MKNELYKKGWNIKTNQLWSLNTTLQCIDDKLYDSPEKDFACLFYKIDEYKMGSYGGLIGLFENKKNSTLIANPQNQWFDWQGDRSLVYSDNLLFLRKLAFNEKESLSGTPFVVFDLEKKVFGFEDFDATSIYYSPVKVKETEYMFNLDTPNELNKNLPNRHGSTFDIKTIKFYSFDMLDRMLDIYFDEKKIKDC